MDRHVISVCIFCFLCATHSPCASHASIGHDDIHLSSENNEQNNPPLIDGFHSKSREKPQDDLSWGDGITKRSSENISVYSSYLKKLFCNYGNGDTMTLKGFKSLIANLDLHQVLPENPDFDEAAICPDLKLDNKTLDNTNTCFDPEEVTSIFNSKNYTCLINYDTFHKIFPALLYGMVVKSVSLEDENNFQVNSILPVTKNGLVWLYSILAVVLISACGVLSLAIIPVMQKKFYKPLIQFLVALAVGTLAGDALLHLLPHAMSSSHHHDDEAMHNSQNHEDASHDENTWKGFVAMLGLTFFFIMERLILLAGKWRKGKQKHAHSHVTVINDRRDNVGQRNDTQCMDRYNPFPYCYKDIMDNPNTTFCDSDKTANTVLELGSNSDIQSCKKSRSPTIEKLETNQNSTECTSDFNITACTEINKMLPNDQKHDHEDYTVIVREHKNEHHGHSHKHGHVHAAPQNYSSVAWMVIMGDGLHNFTDGMAIGAAFSEGVAGGFSTTVAVFCHELPHELGDFAMLLKAGMTIKQALFYNILSSVLCVLGNVFGLWLGNTDYASSWVFAAAAGMFIYIALVDMIPELSSAHEDEGNLMQCILHLGGLLLGFGIMTLIALYEHNLKNVFNGTE